MNKTKHCLLLKTPDNRYFFTHKNNFTQLVEFGRAFAIEISLVKTHDAEILKLEDLARCLCTQTSTECPNYEVLEVKLSTDYAIKPSSKAKNINRLIKKNLLAGERVCLDDLVNKFNIERTTLSKYFSKARKDLAANGYCMIKHKPGQYQLALQKRKSRHKAMLPIKPVDWF